ncbi:glycosyltransferase [Nonlabens ulvanivorans]|uniref:Glycosyltransferase n=1 Tax=Nonlabens ulvanivorans TaxID=906888 RepID=A0A090QBD5_NONUL|nr:DUF2064 domain-containing protein [Nonlabens ulvanivorans]GAK99088.1 glycosyltransferase [Nonlabens ulvanivorans]
MIDNHSQTAILLFAQSARVDAISKALVDVAVMDVLNNHVLNTVRNSGLDYYHFTEKEQRGDSFGLRFKNSIEDVFKLGYTSVICIGNDTPLLSVDLIHKAANSLLNGNSVLGKSQDGGLYLIGLNHSQFDAENFEILPWQSDQLSNCFQQYLKEYKGQITILKTLQDIDSTADLYHFLAGKDALSLIIALLLNSFRVSVITTSNLLFTINRCFFFNLQIKLARSYSGLRFLLP